MDMVPTQEQQMQALMQHLDRSRRDDLAPPARHLPSAGE
jgi:hypothetical protein